MENENEEFDVDTSTSEDTNDTSEDTTTDNEVDVEALKAELEKERQARNQLTARAKKAEEELKKFKTSNTSEEETLQNQPLDVDERILKANGMQDELLKELKAIAQVRGVSLIDAQNDELFKIVKKNFEQEVKTKEASLGASKGSGQARAKKSFSTPGLSKEDHKAMWKEKMGK